MKRYLTGVAICWAWIGLSGFAGTSQADLWTEDFDEALKRAGEDGKCLLLNFTGSDWCGWCIRLNREVFSQETYRKFADENLVCVMVDFPRGKSQSAGQQKANYELSARYGVRGYPSIILLDPKGGMIGRTGYRAGGAEAYVDHLREMIGPYVKTSAGMKQPDDASTPEATGFRIWTSAAGTRLEARYEHRVGNKVVLRRKDGSSVTISIAGLSGADQQFLRDTGAFQ